MWLQESPSAWCRPAACLNEPQVSGSQWTDRTFFTYILITSFCITLTQCLWSVYECFDLPPAACTYFPLSAVWPSTTVVVCVLQCWQWMSTQWSVSVHSVITLHVMHVCHNHRLYDAVVKCFYRMVVLHTKSLSVGPNGSLQLTLYMSQSK